MIGLHTTRALVLVCFRHGAASRAFVSSSSLGKEEEVGQGVKRTQRVTHEKADGKCFGLHSDALLARGIDEGGCFFLRKCS